MLVELHVAQLGVIEDLTLLAGPGMTAVTGETGAGKTLVVEAIQLLLGGRADPVLVRAGSSEAVVEGRFVITGDPSDTAAGGAPEAAAEVVLSRAVPADGRSRAYLDGRMASSAALAEAGTALVELHGQHAHQSLLGTPAQRAALDAAGGVDLSELLTSRRDQREVIEAQHALGGDARTRARELDLLRFQLDELDAAGLVEASEDDHLRAEEERLAGASALRAAAAAAHQALTGDGGAIDHLGEAVAAVGARPPLAGLYDRLRGLEAELADAASEARSMGESLEDDPARLAAVGERRQLLGELRRKYGDTLGEVIEFRQRAAARAAELAALEARAAELDRLRAKADSELAAAEARVAGERRAAAPKVAAEVQRHLRQLAMPRARFAIEVDGLAGEDVTWLLGANPGEPMLPLAKVASGGELARAMLAVRLVMGAERTSSAGTLVFDEVDAGVGGEAAMAVGLALADLARHHQVLVVTHLAQVAAFAEHHVVVRKEEAGGRTTAWATAVRGDERVVELARMMSGQPGSATARRHAEELLAGARRRDIPGSAPAGR